MCCVNPSEKGAFLVGLLKKTKHAGSCVGYSIECFSGSKESESKNFTLRGCGISDFIETLFLW